MQTELQMNAIEYRDGEAELTGQFVWDGANVVPRPGVLVVHGGAGLDEHAMGRAKRLAGLGYVVFACDMYGKNVTGGGREKIMAQIMALLDDRAKLCTRAAAGINVLKAQPHVDGRIAAVGYCFGGMTVLELARSGMELAGVVSVHGSLDTRQPANLESVKAKILVCHGALDPHVPPAHVTAFQGEMNRAGADWQLNVYGGALHGFTHDHGTPMPGVAYHAQADARSSLAIQNFLTETFA
jgi:dienelactone hydrolase